MESAGDAQTYRKVTHVEKCGLARVESVVEPYGETHWRSSQTVKENGYLADTMRYNGEAA